MSTLLTQEISFVEQDVLLGLRQYDKKSEVRISNLIFYPYYFFEYEVNAKSLLRFKGKVGCTIDALEGRGAIVDVQPEFLQRKIEMEIVPEVQVCEEKAREIADKFVFENASSKAKFITIPEIKLLSCTLFYRPFWLAKYDQEEQGQHQLIVDAISGSYHPL
ncbi:hypothetical protein JSQ81_13695 [Sporosarcina sp. Marseille-Q4063]|uniref:hypothetical protein n=1 Tax=Sporosarcina sp. Marseille-Q4063 TaxID=2810514 RepID=UPI001BAF6342|nr:hypothetical protein [Sporosarcina sp. Marseille-Q4063]QUW20865.1 hypothetical protein JSQ81_13695 [Sporosarcina sp. Marseille-Q4063]